MKRTICILLLLTLLQRAGNTNGTNDDGADAGGPDEAAGR